MCRIKNKDFTHAAQASHPFQSSSNDAPFQFSGTKLSRQHLQSQDVFGNTTGSLEAVANGDLSMHSANFSSSIKKEPLQIEPTKLHLGEY